jgi:hypothetical protein
MILRILLAAQGRQVGRELNAALLSPDGVIALERQFDLIFHPKARHSL